MLTEDVLLMLFDELSGEEGAFDAWVAESGYDASWTDQQIYAALPDYIKDLMGDIGLNESWMHDGM